MSPFMEALANKDHFQRWIERPFEVLFFTALGFLLLYPWFGVSDFHEAVLDSMVSLVLLAALMTVNVHSKIRLLAYILFAGALAGSWWPQGSAHSMPHLIGLACTAAFLGLVTYGIFKSVFAQNAVLKDTLFGAVCVYVLLGLTWAYLYIFLESLQPGSFNLQLPADDAFGALSSDLLYYSYTTLTTLGYGDITPVTAQARSLAIVEQVVGVLYIAIMLARLVSMYRGYEAVAEKDQVS